MPVGDSVGVLTGVLFGDVCSVLYVVVIGVSVGALALKKLARAFLLSCHDVFAELVAACNSHCLLLLPVSHSPGKHYTAYLVEHGFRQTSRNEHLFAESVSLQQFLYFPQQPPRVGSTSYMVHVRDCVNFKRMSDFGAVGVPVPVVSLLCCGVPNTIFYFHLGVAQVAHVSQSLVCQGGGAVLVWYRVVGWNGCGVVWWCWS